MLNQFDTAVALDVGINAAILYKNIQHWCEYNETNEKNFFNGYYWTFNSARAFKEQFPYLSEKQIRTALTVLEEKGYIKTGNFNRLGCDRTKWYADTKKGKCILPTGQMEVTHKANANDLQGKPIPNINTENNSNINIIPPLSPRENLFEMFWTAYPQCFRKANKKGCKAKFIKIKDLENTFPDIMSSLEMQKRSKQWNEQDGQFIPAPLTWINQERWTVTDTRTEKQIVADEAAMDLINKLHGGNQ